MKGKKWSAEQRRKFKATMKAKKSAGLVPAAAPAGAASTAMLLHMRKAVAHDIRIQGRVELLASRPVLLGLLALADMEQGRAR